MRHYYDVFELLEQSNIQAFIGSDEYKAHKTKRFRKADNQNITQNDAFTLSDPATRTLYEKAYQDSSALYYDNEPTFSEILSKIGAWTKRL